MRTLLVTGAFKAAKSKFNLLESLGFQVIFVEDEQSPIDLDVSAVDVIICNQFFSYHDIRIFDNLKTIHLTSSGSDQLPRDYIASKGIQVFTAKGVYSIPMAEWIVLKVLEIYKHSAVFWRRQQTHQWMKERNLIELAGKTATIIGYGSVATQVSKRLKAFDVNIIAVSRQKVSSPMVDSYFPVDHLPLALSQSDIVILTAPLTFETHHMIDRNMLYHMKNDSILINVSRGKLIDEQALLEALNRGQFQGVALDVFENEPLNSENPLWDHERVFVTPHNSFVSDRISDRLFDVVLHNLQTL